MSNLVSLTSVLLDRIRHDCIEAHEQALAIGATLTDEELRWQAGPHAPCIGFHLWHLARWAEHDLEQIEGTPQRWRAERIAEAWGFPAGGGEDDTGTELSDGVAASLVFPEKQILLDYVRFGLGSIDAAIARVTHQAERGDGDPEVIANLFAFFTHDNRHLGMMEAIRGVMGTSGTATR